jgi:hypothetical protein
MAITADEFWRGIPADDRYIVAFEEAKAVAVPDRGEEYVLLRIRAAQDDDDATPMGIMIRKDHALFMVGAIGNALANLEVQKGRQA